jgi:quaternary ammonium compound-resistance protein SugE
MSWGILFIAGLLEIAWAVGLKYTEGFTKFWPSIGTIFALVASLILLSFALKTLPVGTAYAVWVGIGALGTAVLGIILFGESAGVLKLVSLGLICAGIVGLKLADIQ